MDTAMNMGITLMQTANNEVEKVPVLPDWTRWSWRSMDERAWYKPQFQQASVAYQNIERMSVVKGIRPAAYHNVAKNGLVEATRWAHQHGILCVPFSLTGPTGAYSSTAQNYTDHNFQYRVFYVRPEFYKDAYPATNEELGKLLGYPECCRAAFEATWGQGQVDSTWEQTSAGKTPDGPFGCNTLLRWMGLRFVSHMPCTYQCSASKTIADQMMALGLEMGYHDEMALIKEVLNWPVKWSRLFGIAEIVTPALKISTRTDWTPTKQEFFRKGHYIRVTKDMWADNGFGSADAMWAAHTDIINALRDSVPHGVNVVDLGCGNGHLMRRLAIHRPDLRTTGIDINADAIKRANPLINLRRNRFECASIQDCGWAYDTDSYAVVVNPARLLEMNADDAGHVRTALSHQREIYTYLYDDWQGKATLAEVCEKAGLPAPEPLIKTPKVEMGLIRK
jgi:hypothetical protein